MNVLLSTHLKFYDIFFLFLVTWNVLSIKFLSSFKWVRTRQTIKIIVIVFVRNKIFNFNERNKKPIFYTLGLFVPVSIIISIWCSSIGNTFLESKI